MKSSFSKDVVVEALKMYIARIPLKEIQEKLGLPKGNTGESLISQWRKRAGLPARTKIHNWDEIKQEVQA